MPALLLGFLPKLFTGVGLKIMMGLAIAGAILAILFKVEKAGRTAERVESLRRTLKSVEERNEVELSIGRLDGDAAVEQLRSRWSRD